MRTVLCLFLVLFIYPELSGQDLILSVKHKDSGFVYEVDPERAVKYRLSEGGTKRGYIQSLAIESMVIDGEIVNYQDVVMLSSWHTRKNSSAKTSGILLTSLGGLLTAAGVVIIAKSIEEDDASTVIGIPFGVAATAVGLGTTYLGIRALKRKRFDMMDWDFEVNSY